jgi:hypothetical protein
MVIHDVTKQQLAEFYRGLYRRETYAVAGKDCVNEKICRQRCTEIPGRERGHKRGRAKEGKWRQGHTGGEIIKGRDSEQTGGLKAKV